MSELERGVGVVLGIDHEVAALRPARGIAGARAVLEELILTALHRPPCAVSFSGGRDSSLVLAVATSVARRHGLPDPVPITLRFPAVGESDESGWQQSLVDHLGLSTWERVTLTDELDLLGPVALPVLRRHGLQWPFNAYFHIPVLDRVRGGSVLTGVGGDEILSEGWAWQRENGVLGRARRPRPLDPVRVVVSLGPEPLRHAFLRLRERAQGGAPAPAWLTPAGWHTIRNSFREVADLESLSFSRSVRRSYARTRARSVATASLAALAAERDVRTVSPLVHSRFLQAVSAERGWRMFRSRTEATRWLAGDVLPPALVARGTKAYFDEAFFGSASRTFGKDWDGSGLDERYVRPEVLRRMWTDSERVPDARTFPFVQQAWLAARAQPSVDESSDATSP